MKKTKKTQTIRHHKIKIAGFAVLGLLLLVLLTLQFWFNSLMFDKVNTLEVWQMKSLVTSPVRDMGRAPVTDFATDKKYIPEAQLSLPRYPENLSEGIIYSYNRASDMGGAYVEISSVNAKLAAISQVNMAQEMGRIFEKVPEMQACTRQGMIFFPPIDGTWDLEKDYTKIQSSKLTDGRSYEIYISKACPYDKDALPAYLKNIQSY